MPNNVPIIGLDMFHVAKVTADTAEAITYVASTAITNIVEAAINFNAEQEKFFADNGPAVVYTQMGDIEVTIDCADLTPTEYALLTGATHVAETGVIEMGDTTQPPEFAIGFRAMKSDGTYRYIWILKGQFTIPNMAARTKEESVDFQTQELTFSAVKRVKDGKIMRRVDSDDEKLPTGAGAALPTTWFTDPDFVPVAVVG